MKTGKLIGRRILLLAALIALALPATLQAQFTFITNNGAITITKYTGPGGTVVIPSITNGYPVTTIGASAFLTITNVTNVTIPDSISSIGLYAFAACSSLTNVTIGTNVSSIYDDAFDDSGLRSVAIPNSVTNLGAFVFYSCSGLKNATIGNSVINIGQSAFWACGSLTNVIIGNSVTNIGLYAFTACSGLQSVSIPDSVRSIADYAFDGCGLTNVNIGNGVRSIGAYSFYNCYSLTNVTIPDGVITIGTDAFGACSLLMNVAIGNGVSGIGDYAFEDTALWNVAIPNSVMNIGISPFRGCNNLTNIAVNATNPNYSSAAGVLFNATKTTLIEYPGGLAGSYAIPDSVTSVSTSAFARSFGLTNVTVPKCVTNIGLYAFLSCWNLGNAYFLGNAPSVNGRAGSADSTVFAADPGQVYFVPGTSGWGPTFGGLSTVSWYQRQPQILGSDHGLGVRSNKFQFIISWATNTSVVVQASTNLQNWTPVITNTLVNGTNLFSDPQSSNYPNRFYRIRSP